MSTFEVGEVAIYLGHYGRLCGTEVTVKSTLQYGEIYNWQSRQRESHPFYEIDSPILDSRDRYYQPCAAPWELQKRHPSQDWVSLCQLDAVPIERERELA